MAKPSVIEARKARALEAMQAQLDRIESKLDAVLARGEQVFGSVELTVLPEALEALGAELAEREPVGEQASEPKPEPAPEKGKGKNK